MLEAANSSVLLMAVAYTLGIRHGFDLDHLATIDSISRALSSNKLLSRISGILFASGHGLVVIAVSVILGSGIIQSQIPSWLEGVGGAISVFFLFLFGIITLWNVSFNPQKNFNSLNLKSFLSGKLITQKTHPIFIMGVGALFAFSFDTYTQIALFTISANTLSGCVFSVLLGIMFTLGMITSDGLNGIFISGLIQRADKISISISRIFGLLIALFSLIIGGINFAKIIQ